MIVCKFKFKPKLRLAVPRYNVHMHSYLLTRKEEKSKSLLTKNGRTHTRSPRFGFLNRRTI